MYVSYMYTTRTATYLYIYIPVYLHIYSLFKRTCKFSRFSTFSSHDTLSRTRLISTRIFSSRVKHRDPDIAETLPNNSPDNVNSKYRKNKSIKSLSVTRPKSRFGCLVWSSSYRCRVNPLEKIRHKFPRLTVRQMGNSVPTIDRDYSHVQSLTNALPLVHRRIKFDLVFARKVLDGSVLM